MLRWLLFFALFPLLAPTAGAQTVPEGLRTVSVTGEGVIRAEPDQATLRFGVVTEAASAENAREANAAAASRALNAVRELGVPERKIRLETLSLQPRREFDPETRRYRELGYEAVREVVVELDDLELLPVVVAQVVESGANRLNGIAYDLQNRDAVRSEALREAVLTARTKAALLAETLGEGLGAVHSINEQSFDFPRPMYRAAMAMDMAKAEAAPEPEAYAAGEIEVRAVVAVTFLLQ